MTFTVPQRGDSSARLADWLELRTLSKSSGESRINELYDAEDFADGNKDIEEDDSTKDDIIAKALTEISTRTDYLGDSYPFIVSDCGQYLCLKDGLSYGQLTYLLCLRLSLAQTDIIEDGFLPEISQNERNLFQACSTLCASGYLLGNGFSFGWPRADGTGILDALRRVQSEMKEGKVRQSLPVWTSQRPKDDEVDIIGIITPNDGQPGMAYLLGQVASGANWKDKPLSSDKIKQFHDSWYEMSPVSEPMRAIFIPFCLHDEEGYESLPDMSLKIRTSVIEYGIIFYRYRLPFYVQRAIIAYSEGRLPGNIDHINDLPRFQSWWDDFKAAMISTLAA